MNYAQNAGKVDGYDAVQAKSSNDKAAGRLVATYAGGDERGKRPSASSRVSRPRPTWTPSPMRRRAGGRRNTFAIQLQAAPTTTVLIEGAAEQRGEGTGDGSCIVWATALFVD